MIHMWQLIRADFLAEYDESGYQGRFRKTFHAMTSPGFQAIFLYRISHQLGKLRIPMIGMMLQRIAEVWTGISISPKASIGPGLIIYHFGGVIINGNAEIGRDCRIHHEVTIGNRQPGGPSPKLGDRVMIGAGAKLLGDITIGNDAEIGANAVVLNSVPEKAIAVGVPARVVRTKE